MKPDTLLARNKHWPLVLKIKLKDPIHLSMKILDNRSSFAYFLICMNCKYTSNWIDQIKNIYQAPSIVLKTENKAVNKTKEALLFLELTVSWEKKNWQMIMSIIKAINVQFWEYVAEI